MHSIIKYNRHTKHVTASNVRTKMGDYMTYLKLEKKYNFRFLVDSPILDVKIRHWLLTMYITSQTQLKACATLEP